MKVVGILGITIILLFIFLIQRPGLRERWKKGKDGLFFDHDGELGPCCFTCGFSRNAGTWTIG